MQYLAIQQSCVSICADLRLLDLHAFETQASEPIVKQLKHELHIFIEKTLRLLERVSREPLEALDNSDDSIQFKRGVDQLMDRSDAQERLEFLKSLSAGMLRSKVERIESLNIHIDWLDILEAMASARRCVLKTLIALERCVSDLAGVNSNLDYYSETQKGITVRRLYGELRFELEEAERSNVDVEQALRCAGLGIAKMMRLDAYEYFRFHDRRQLLDIKSRLRAWFSGEHEERSGKHLFDDIRFTVQLLMEINRREELIEYDLKTVKSCIARIEEHRNKGFCDSLMTLVGRSQRLDDLIFTFTDEDLLHDVLLELEQELLYAHGYPRQRA